MPLTQPCHVSTDALTKIAAVPWTPYIASSLQERAVITLYSPNACAGPLDCTGCGTLRTIADLSFGPALAHRIQELARTQLGQPSAREALSLDPVRRRA